MIGPRHYCSLLGPIAAFIAWYLAAGKAPELAAALSAGDGRGVPAAGTSRRDLLAGGCTAAAAAAAFPWAPSAAAAANGAAGDARPIAVLGASGRTGALCVSACLAGGVPVRALTRSGEWRLPADGDAFGAAAGASGAAAHGGGMLSVGRCDVRDATSVAEAVAGCRAVVYAASASRGGGSAREIDNEAVVAAAGACIAAAVPRYVVISSTATTRPRSLGYIFTNVFSSGGIMDEKRRGEVGVQLAYAAAASAAAAAAGSPVGSSYTIIRPGGLEEPKENRVLGPSALELSQGDALAGIVSRADLAATTVAAALSDAPGLRDASFEVYYTDSVQPCEGRFKALVDSGKVARIHGEGFDAMFRGLAPDGEYYVPE